MGRAQIALGHVDGGGSSRKVCLGATTRSREGHLGATASRNSMVDHLAATAKTTSGEYYLGATAGNSKDMGRTQIGLNHIDGGGSCLSATAGNSKGYLDATAGMLHDQKEEPNKNRKQAAHVEVDALGDAMDHPMAGAGEALHSSSSRFSNNHQMDVSKMKKNPSAFNSSSQAASTGYEEAQCHLIMSSRSSGVSSIIPAQHPMASSPVTDFPCAEYDPWPEILCCAGTILSKPWKEIWEQTPLVFHDRLLVRLLPPQDEPYQIGEIISEMLLKHPGPIAYFRVELTKCTGYLLWKWSQRLSEKKAEEIVIVNQGYEARPEFPLEELQSGHLKRLRLGFFSLGSLDLCSFEYSGLDTLQLLGCSFNTHRLYHVVKECRNLSHLEIGLSINDIKLHSESLKHIQVWRAKLRNFAVDFAPKLLSVVTGMEPKEKDVTVTVSGTPSLREFEYLILNSQKIDDHSWMKTLKKLKVGIQMASGSQRALMSKYLQTASALEELSIWRMDDIGPSEQLDVAVDESLAPFNTGKGLQALLTFQMEDFKGGAMEVFVAHAVLKSAANLRKFWVCTSADSSEARVNQVFDGLHNVDRASKKCDLKRRKPLI